MGRGGHPRATRTSLLGAIQGWRHPVLAPADTDAPAPA